MNHIFRVLKASIITGVCPPRVFPRMKVLEQDLNVIRKLNEQPYEPFDEHNFPCPEHTNRDIWEHDIEQRLQKEPYFRAIDKWWRIYLK